MKFSILNFQFSHLLLITLITFVLFLIPILTQAASAELVPCGYDKNNDGKFDPATEGCTFCDFFVLFNNIINFIFKLVPAVAAFMLVVAGFKFFMAIENPNEVAEARKIIISVIIGLVIIYSAWAFVGLFLNAVDLADWTKDIFRNWWTNGFFQINCSTP